MNLRFLQPIQAKREVIFNFNDFSFFISLVIDFFILNINISFSSNNLNRTGCNIACDKILSLVIIHREFLVQ